MKHPLRRLLALAALTATGLASADDALENRFDDPFFQITAALPDCPVPAGPFITESEWREQAHRRIEKGTTCWLAHECDRPNAYAYDQDIAAAFKAALRNDDRFAATSLWVTVQGRVVYIEGCVAHAAQEAELEAFARSLPHVQQALAIVRSDASARPPYRLRHPA